MDILTLRVLLVVLCVSRGREATDNYKNHNKEMLGFRGGQIEQQYSHFNNHILNPLRLLSNMILHGAILFLARFDADNWNKLKNLASKVIGEKMKVSNSYIFENKPVVIIKNQFIKFRRLYVCH